MIKNLIHLLLSAETSNLKNTLIITKTSAPLKGLETNLSEKIKYLIKINNNIIRSRWKSFINYYRHTEIYIYIYIYSSLSLDKGYGNTGYIYIDLYCSCLDIYLVVYLKYMSWYTGTSHIYIYIYICMNVYMYVCVCVYELIW